MAWSIDFASPSDGTTSNFINRDYILVNVTSSAINTTNITIDLYNADWSIINTSSTTLDNSSELFANFSGLPEGLYYINVTAIDNDSDSKVNATNVTVDFINPSIWYSYFTDNGTHVNRPYILINVSANDTNLYNITSFVYNGSFDLINTTTIIMTESNAYLFFNQSVSVDGTYYFNATAYDKAGNSNSTNTRNIIIDTTAPYFTFIPENATIYYSEDWIGADFNATDNISVVSFSINNSTLFTINASGYLNDVPLLPIGIYVVNITINDSAGNTNWATYELTVQNISAPIINVNSPINNYVKNKNYVLLNVTVYDAQLRNMTVWFFANGSLINTTYNHLNGTSVTYNWTSLPDGNYNWTAIAGDGLSNSTNTYSYFIIDITNPSIIINTPTNTTYNTTTILINITSNDTNIDKTWFFNGTANETYIGPINITYAEGTYQIIAWANDTAGNINSANRTFSIAINYEPTATYNSPTNNSNINTNSTQINITIYDQDADNMTVWLYSDGNLTSTYYNQTNGTTIIYNWTALSDGIHNWTAIANDGTTNSTFEYRYFTINTTVASVVTPPSSGGSKSSSSNSGGGGSDMVYFPASNDNLNMSVVEFSQYFPKLLKGNQTINIDISGMPITYFSLNFNADANITDTLNLVSQINNPENTSINSPIYEYILINTTLNQYIDEIFFKFKINRSWIKQNNLNEDNITIYNYDTNDKGWTQTKASRNSEDTGYVYYSASTKKISNFAIGGPTIGKIESKKTIIEEAPILINTTNTAIDSSKDENSVNKKGFLERTGEFLKNAKDNLYTYIARLDSDTQELIVITLSSVLILIVGVVSGVLVYKNTIKPRRLRKIHEHNQKIISRTITPYSEEPALTQQTTQPTEQQPETTAHIEEKPSNIPKEEPMVIGPEYSIKKINELIAQCEYALGNGRIEESKRYYDEARAIYFNSGLDYEKKSKVYTKIIELHNILNKK